MSSLFWNVVGQRLLFRYWRFDATYWFRYVFPRNAAKQLPIYNVQIHRRAKALATPQRKSQISHETCNILSKWTTTSCPRRIKVHLINQQRKERYDTCRTAPVSLDEECSEIRFQTFQFEVHILRCQKICTAYYNVPTLHDDEKVRVHLCKIGRRIVLEAESPIHAILQVVEIAFTLPLGSFIIFIVTVTTLPWREEKDFPDISTAK